MLLSVETYNEIKLFVVPFVIVVTLMVIILTRIRIPPSKRFQPKDHTVAFHLETTMHSTSMNRISMNSTKIQLSRKNSSYSATNRIRRFFKKYFKKFKTPPLLESRYWNDNRNVHSLSTFHKIKRFVKVYIQKYKILLLERTNWKSNKVNCKKQRDNNNDCNKQRGNDDGNKQRGNGDGNKQRSNGDGNKQCGNDNCKKGGYGDCNKQHGNGNCNKQHGNGNCNKQHGNGNCNKQHGNGDCNKHHGNGNCNKHGNDNCKCDGNGNCKKGANGNTFVKNCGVEDSDEHVHVDMTNFDDQNVVSIRKGKKSRKQKNIPLIRQTQLQELESSSKISVDVKKQLSSKHKANEIQECHNTNKIQERYTRETSNNQTEDIPTTLPIKKKAVHTTSVLSSLSSFGTNMLTTDTHSTSTLTTTSDSIFIQKTDTCFMETGNLSSFPSTTVSQKQEKTEDPSIKVLDEDVEQIQVKLRVYCPQGLRAKNFCIHMATSMRGTWEDLQSIKMKPCQDSSLTWELTLILPTCITTFSYKYIAWNELNRAWDHGPISHSRLLKHSHSMEILDIFFFSTRYLANQNKYVQEHQTSISSFNHSLAVFQKRSLLYSVVEGENWTNHTRSTLSTITMEENRYYSKNGSSILGSSSLLTTTPNDGDLHHCIDEADLCNIADAERFVSNLVM